MQPQRRNYLPLPHVERRRVYKGTVCHAEEKPSTKGELNTCSTALAGFFWPSRCHKPLALRALHPHLPRHWFYEHHGDAETQPTFLIFTECLVHDVGIAPRAFAIVGYAFLAPQYQFRAQSLPPNFSRATVSSSKAAVVSSFCLSRPVAASNLPSIFCNASVAAFRCFARVCSTIPIARCTRFKSYFTTPHLPKPPV